MRGFFNWFSRFFRDDTPESMMRLISLILAVGGLVHAFVFEHSFLGLEIIAISILGKAYQKGTELKKSKNE